MSNSKISALPSASTPLAGTEVLPVVQGGITEQVSVANLTAGRAVSANSMTLTTALAATSGGTGSTSAFVANAIPYASSTTVLATSANWTYNGTNVTLLNGGLGFGGSPLAGQIIRGIKNITGSVNSTFIRQQGIVQSDVTTSAYAFDNVLQTAATAFTLAVYRHFNAQQSALGVGSAVTTQTGFNAEANLIGATNNYGFRGQIPSSANRYNIYMDGTAPNWFSGDVLVFGAGGLGYTTGSGGTVTQGTSRTTGVTLNKTNGAITLFSAAGLATFQSFTVTNSTVAATDVVQVSQKSGTDLYQIFVTAVAAGSFRITFATTGGVTIEQPVFNFAVIKAVTA
jgi:hypothetical protein